MSSLLDPAALRKACGSGSEWARGCGAEVKKVRQQRGWTLEQVAGLTGTTVQTLSAIERGLIVPRDHLRAAVSFVLSVETPDLWPPLTRKRIHELAAA